MLAGLARDTTRIRLGALVSPVTFRLPGNFAKVVATVQEMSGGRLELGLGAGWNDDEHRQYGFPFPPIDVRAEMLEEQLEIVRGLWKEPDGWSFHGRHYTIEDALFRLARPTSAGGRRSSSAATAAPRSMRHRRADSPTSTTSPAPGPDEIGAKYRQPRRGVPRHRPRPATLTRSAMVTTLIAARSGGRRAPGRTRCMGRIGAQDARETRAAWLARADRSGSWATFDEAREPIRRFADGRRPAADAAGHVTRGTST